MCSVSVVAVAGSPREAVQVVAVARVKSRGQGRTRASSLANSHHIFGHRGSQASVPQNTLPRFFTILCGLGKSCEVEVPAWYLWEFCSVRVLPATRVGGDLQERDIDESSGAFPSSHVEFVHADRRQ